MPADRVTTVMNSSDTDRIRAVRAALEPGVAEAVRRELGMADGPVAVFLGGLYPLKRPQFLVDAARALRNRIGDLELLVIGGGTEAHIVEAAAADAPWIHAVGAVYGDERVRLASVGSVHLMPGAIGLNIVDAFALGLPTITVDLDYHGPEIGYLQPGVNGEVAPRRATPERYAELVQSVLGDQARLEALTAAAEAAGRELSIEHMVERFARGVVDALDAPRRS